VVRHAAASPNCPASTSGTFATTAARRRCETTSACSLTLGLYWFWHVAHRQRYYWEHTSFGSAQFRSSLDGGELLSFTLANALLTIVTLGIAYP